MNNVHIYFACSIRGGGDTSSYQAIVDAIKAAGAACLSEIFINDAIALKGSPLPDNEIYARDIAWIHKCDAVIAEVSNPSLGVGYELAYSEQLQKPVLTLFHAQSSGKLSAMIAGNRKLTNRTYNTNKDIKQVVTSFIQSLR